MTDTSKMRSEFEVAYTARLRKGGFEGVVEFARLDDGYANMFTDGAWCAWQASRQAVVVELPDTVANTGTLTSNAVLSYKRECKEAIEAACLRCEVKL